MRTHFLALVLVAALGGCSSPAATRAVSGQLRVDTSTMNHPVVIAQSSDHRLFVAGVTASGRFTLQLPANVSYRLTLSSATATPGVYSAVARINWPLASGASRWAALGGGGALDLGAVYQRGTRPAGLGTNDDDDHGDDHADGGAHDGDDDHGDCHEDDHACDAHGGDVDDDCDHRMSAGDHCDKDDDADAHDKDADDDDHDKCNADGGATGGGGGGGGSGGGGGDLGGIR